MSIFLAPVSFSRIQSWFVDFQKKSKCFELPPDESELLGIFNDEELIGYFVLLGYKETLSVTVHQGYLKASYRHLDLPKECLRQMEDMCKAAGFKKIVIVTKNRFGAYLKFMRSNGYAPNHLEFEKEI